MVTLIIRVNIITIKYVEDTFYIQCNHISPTQTKVLMLMLTFMHSFTHVMKPHKSYLNKAIE